MFVWMTLSVIILKSHKCANEVHIVYALNTRYASDFRHRVRHALMCLTATYGRCSGVSGSERLGLAN